MQYRVIGLSLSVIAVWYKKPLNYSMACAGKLLNLNCILFSSFTRCIALHAACQGCTQTQITSFNSLFSYANNIYGCITVDVVVYFIDAATVKVKITLVNIYIPVFIADCFCSPSASSTALVALRVLLTSAAGQTPFHGRQHIKLIDRPWGLANYMNLRS